MNLKLTRTSSPMHFICVFVAIFLLNFSCSKDSDTLSEQTVNEEIIPLVEQDSTETSTNSEQEVDEEIDGPKEDLEDDRIISEDCSTISTDRDVEGFKQWCWNDLESDVNNNQINSSFSDGVLYTNSHHKANGIWVENGRINFRVQANASSLDYRQEIRPDAYLAASTFELNTEEWLGYNYAFGADYVPAVNPWVLNQFKQEGTISGPMITLQPLPENHAGLGNAAGEICVVNQAINGESNTLVITKTGVVPVAGGNYDIVTRMVWGDDVNGSLKIWINGTVVYDQQERIVYSGDPKVGYWKLGIYHSSIRSASSANAEIANGSGVVHTSISNVRNVIRQPTHADYGQSAYNLVEPR